jgi:predicted RNA-binding Zn-ribbon protein involved in translation (DUF1610 family)
MTGLGEPGGAGGGGREGARARPKYEPRAVKCAACGAGLEPRDEATRFVVCPYCSAHLELDEAEARVLGHPVPSTRRFDYDIGDFFLWEGARYVVAARLVFVDAGASDDGPATVEYLLFSPRRGTLYLDLDDGEWLLSRPVHLMPRTEDPFALAEGREMETYDGARWRLADSCTSRLVYVDGALPWVARVGDRVEFATFRAVHDRRQGYEVERDSGETEFNKFRVVSRDELAAARISTSPTRASTTAGAEAQTGVGDREGAAAGPPAASGDDDDDPAAAEVERVRTSARWLFRLAGIAAFFVLLNFGLSVRASGRGAVVLDHTFLPGERPPLPPAPALLGRADAGADASADAATTSPPQVADTGDAASDLEPVDPSDPPDPPEPEEVPIQGGVERPTDSFDLRAPGLVRIELSADQLQEAWSSVDLAIVQGDDTVTHILDGDLAYYDDDDDPSSGSRTDALYAWVDDPGTYHLLVRTMGGRGESESPGDLPAPVRVKVIASAASPEAFQTVAGLSLVLAVVLGFVGLSRRGKAERLAKGEDGEGDGPESEP